MTISTELQERYTSEVDVDWAWVFRLEHPKAVTRYIIDGTTCPQQYEVNVNGHLHLFEPVPTKITMPTRDDSGRSDMSISWCGVHHEALEFLNQAIVDGTVPIACFFSIVIFGSPDPQIDPWMEFNLTNTSVTESEVAATASRADILNRSCPGEVYRVERYPGLRRR